MVATRAEEEQFLELEFWSFRAAFRAEDIWSVRLHRLVGPLFARLVAIYNVANGRNN